MLKKFRKVSLLTSEVVDRTYEVFVPAEWDVEQVRDACHRQELIESAECTDEDYCGEELDEVVLDDEEFVAIDGQYGMDEE